VGQQASQHGLDARHQLAQIERLGHVVIGADFEPDDFVNRIAAACDDDDAALPASSNASCDGKAVFAGQTEVQQQEIGRIALHELNQGIAMVNLGHAKAMGR